GRTQGRLSECQHPYAEIMIRYLSERLFRLLLTLFLVLSFAFVILRLSGDPALIIMSPDAPQEAIEAFRKSWGLDAPIWQQYVGYFVNLLQGNFGVRSEERRVGKGCRSSGGQ